MAPPPRAFESREQRRARFREESYTAGAAAFEAGKTIRDAGAAAVGSNIGRYAQDARDGWHDALAELVRNLPWPPGPAA